MTMKKRLTAAILALLLLIISVFTFTTVRTKSANAGIYTRLSVKLRGGNGEVYAEAENAFTFFPATVRVHIQLYRSDGFEESYENMTLVGSNYTNDLDQGEKIRAYAPTGGRRAYYLARMYYKIDSDEWAEKTMGVFRFDGNGNELYGLPVYSDEYLNGATKATVTAENSFTVDYDKDITKLVTRLKNIELDKVGAMPNDAQISIELDNGLTVYGFDDGTLYFKVVKPYADGIYRSADKIDFDGFKSFLSTLGEDIESRVEIDVYKLMSEIKSDLHIDIEGEWGHRNITDLKKIEKIVNFFADVQPEFNSISYSDCLKGQKNNITLYLTDYYLTLNANNDILLTKKLSYECAVAQNSNLSFSDFYDLIKEISPDVEVDDIKLDELIKQNDKLVYYCREGFKYITCSVESKERIEEIASFFKDITFERSKGLTILVTVDDYALREIPYFNIVGENVYVKVQDDGLIQVQIQKNEILFYFKSEENVFDKDMIEELKNFFKN